MPEDKKNQQKSRNDPKDQRRRRGRQHAGPVEKKVEKEPEAPKVTAPEKPAYEPPPPEFYKSLKRETDEILKITEEATTKYKKKEIQSNWAKYEMPIESYEEIDEHENLGADYEALIQAPLSVGGHFQFKHEKSWDITTGPSPYDKYFEINMDNLSTALSCIPFYERNTIDISFFNESDIQTMNHRANKYKLKYYNDKKFMTPELEAQNKILNSIIGSKTSDECLETNESSENLTTNDITNEKRSELKEINLEECEQEQIQAVSEEILSDSVENNSIKTSSLEKEMLPEMPVPEVLSKPKEEAPKDLEIVTNVHKNSEISVSKGDITTTQEQTVSSNMKKKDDNKLLDSDFEEISQNLKKDKSKEKIELPKDKSKEKVELPNEAEMQFHPILPPMEQAPKETTPQREVANNPIIESPEDLEKWLDDFLDG